MKVPTIVQRHLARSVTPSSTWLSRTILKGGWRLGLGIVNRVFLQPAAVPVQAIHERSLKNQPPSFWMECGLVAKAMFFVSM